MCEICLAVVLRPPMGTVAGSCGSRPARALWSLRRPPDPPDPPVPSALVGPGVLLWWLTRSLPRVRYKTLPARCFVEQSGTKLSLCGQNAPNWAILGERGEFCTGHAVRVGVPGEFCTGGARCGCCWANNAVLWRSPCASRRAMAAPWRCSRALRPGPSCPPAPSAPVGPGR